MQRKNCRTGKKNSLTFKETIAWVASKVYVHMQKAEPGTNIHWSTL